MAKILIVEDNPIDMAAVSEIIENLGHSIVKAEDGETGLEVAKNENPDLIVLDIILPGMNGFEVCRALKSDPATENFNIVMMTTKDQDSDKFWGMKQGADDYLTKPIEADALTAAINKLL